jgi:hypothetical protein
MARQEIGKAEELLLRVDTFVTKSEEAIHRSQSQGRIATMAVERSLAKRCTELSNLKKDLEFQIKDTSAGIADGEKGLDKFCRRANLSDKAQAAKLEGALKLLEGLKATKIELQENLRCKIEALNIDNSCRRITPQVAAETQTRPASTPALKRPASAPCIHDFSNAVASPSPVVVKGAESISDVSDALVGFTPQPKGAETTMPPALTDAETTMPLDVTAEVAAETTTTTTATSELPAVSAG